MADLKERFREIYRNALVPNVDREVQQMEDYLRNHPEARIAQAAVATPLPIVEYQVPLGIMNAPRAAEIITADDAVSSAVKAANDDIKDRKEQILSIGPAFAEKLGYDWNELSKGQKAAILDLMFDMSGPLPEISLTPEQVERKAQIMIANSNAQSKEDPKADEAKKQREEEKERKKKYETGYEYDSYHLERKPGESEDLPNAETHMRGELSGYANPTTPKSIEDVATGNINKHKLHMGTESDLSWIADKHYNGGSVKPQVSNNVRNNIYKLSPKEQLDYYDFYNGIISRQFTNGNSSSFDSSFGNKVYSTLANDRVQRKINAQRMGINFEEDEPLLRKNKQK